MFKENLSFRVSKIIDSSLAEIANIYLKIKHKVFWGSFFFIMKVM